MRSKSIWLILALILGPYCAWAGNDDNFSPVRKIAGQHFDIYYDQGVDLKGLLKQLNVSHADEILSGQTLDNSSDERRLSSMMDILFLRSSDILDLHVYSYKGSIKIFKSFKDLTDYYNKLYHASLPGTGYAFYLDDKRSVYISSEYFNRDIIGHEIGYAIMSSYFVVLPSLKIQEVLAGYIEYQLKKSE